MGQPIKMAQSTSNTVQTFWVMVGSLSAFAFTIVSSMILSRYFNKEDYGTYKQVMYVYSTFLIVFTLGLPKAYSFFLPRIPDDQAKDLINKINNVLLFSGALMSITLFLLSKPIAVFLKNDDLAVPLMYFSPVPFLMLPTMGLEGILSTYKKSFLIAIYNIITRVLMLCCVALPVLIWKGGVKDAILGFTIASFISFLVALYLKSYPVRQYNKEKSGISYKNVFKYTLPIMFAGIWGTIINSTDQFFISRYFGSEVFADFANGSLELPFVGMIISAGSVVLSPIYSKHNFRQDETYKKETMRLWHSVFSKTVKLIYPVVVFFFCFADIIMMLLYGEKYQTSGIFFQIKLVVNFFTLISYGPLVLSIGGEKHYYRVHLYGALLLIALEALSVYTIKSAVAITVISVICQIGRILAMLYFVAKYFKVDFIDLFPVKLILNLIIPSFLILLPLRFFLIKYTTLDKIFIVAISAVVYVVLMFFWTKYKKIDYYSIFKPLLQKFVK